MPTAMAKLIDERDNLRKADPTTTRIQELNRTINNSIKEHRQKKWLETLENCAPGSKKLWDTIKQIDSPPKNPENQSISFNNKPQHDPKKIANSLNSQYKPSAKVNHTQQSRNLLRNIQRPTSNFTTYMTEEKIKKTKSSKAIGPDGISPIMLKHLGPAGLAYLTNLFNKILQQAIIPRLWKVESIVPLLKPQWMVMSDCLARDKQSHLCRPESTKAHRQNGHGGHRLKPSLRHC